jgi:hypothetical protein
MEWWTLETGEGKGKGSGKKLRGNFRDRKGYWGKKRKGKEALGRKKIDRNNQCTIYSCMEISQ